jgi:hypothetical protein
LQKKVNFGQNLWLSLFFVFNPFGKRTLSTSDCKKSEFWSKPVALIFCVQPFWKKDTINKQKLIILQQK